eukprot:Lankesteria_metandrocarpae@DN368_c0_g1_i1.p1
MASELVSILIVTVLVIWIFIILLVLFVLGDPDGDLWVDSLYRCVYVIPAKIFRYIIWFIFGDRGLRCTTNCCNYIVYQNNCLVQILYLFVIIGGYSIFLYGGAPYLPNAYLEEYHKYTSFVLVSVCLMTFVVASVADPGVITEENVELYSAVFPPDGVIFVPGNECRTCLIPKPGRAKHCKLCNVCVAKFDHHCVWIANDVGALNYRWFVLFLVVHALLCIYGAVGLPLTLYHEYKRHNLWSVSFVHPRTGAKVTTTWAVITQFLLNRYFSIVLLCFLCIPLAVAMVAFTAYHFYMGFWLNRTTNESCKSPADVQGLYASGMLTHVEEDCAAEAQYRAGMEALTRTYNTPKSVWRNFMSVARPYSWLQQQSDVLQKGKTDQGDRGLSSKAADCGLLNNKIGTGKVRSSSGGEAGNGKDTELRRRRES